MGRGSPTIRRATVFVGETCKLVAAAGAPEDAEPMAEPAMPADSLAEPPIAEG